MSEAERLALLLEAAREELRAEIAPQLDAERRYRAAMIGNALAIGARRLRAGDEPEAAELEALRRLYPDANEAAADDLGALRGRLVEDLRAGRLDGAADRLVRAVLRVRIEGRLAISNPGQRP